MKSPISPLSERIPRFVRQVMSAAPWRPLSRLDLPELMDGADWTDDELRANFRDIRRINRLAGGVSAILDELPSLLRDVPSDREAVILDLGTGSADIPLAIVRWARRQQRPVRVIASDASPAMLAIAWEHTASIPEIELERRDARAVPMPDRSVDVVLCSLTLHHFPPDEACAILAEMRRLARAGFVVNDLVRNRRAYAAAWLTARLFTRNRLTRHDAPLSVLRAYTPAELAELLHMSGATGARVHTRPLFRMVGVWQAPPDATRPM